MNVISWETRIRFTYPMTSTMVQALTEGWDYHDLCERTGGPALADTMIKAALKGFKNKESLNKTPRAVMTLDQIHLPLPWELSGVTALDSKRYDPMKTL